MRDLTMLPVRELCRRIAAGDLSPVDLVDAFLARMHALDERLGCLTATYDEQARADAEAAEERARRGCLLGPLDGIPIVVKDLFEIAGQTTMAGSLHWKDRRSTSTAAPVVELMNRGAIILGKTHMAEFGLGTTGTNQHLGTPRNPWSLDTHVAPGGSSSGSAVAVAAGLSPWALGTDTGGSVRIPASWCGVVGFKPTRDRISLAGVTPLSPTLDSVGAIARSVDDIAILYEALVERGQRRPHHADRLDPAALVTPNGARLRIAPMPACERDRVEEDVLRTYDEAVRVFRALDASIVEIAFPRRLDDYLERSSTITIFEAASQYGDMAEDPSIPLDDRVRALLAIGNRIPPEDYRAALRELPSLRAEFDLLFDAVDAIVTPTTQAAARPVAGIAAMDPPNHFTRFVNLLGLCAIAVPCGFSRDGLPCSLQIICRSYQERMMLRIARAYQVATDWHRYRAPEWRRRCA
jgi:aspartyl-tRNA(Asn)/glutamyl-tRNA(Gln) amidotransferase subunit A